MVTNNFTIVVKKSLRHAIAEHLYGEPSEKQVTSFTDAKIMDDMKEYQPRMETLYYMYMNLSKEIMENGNNWDNKKYSQFLSDLKAFISIVTNLSAEEIKVFYDSYSPNLTFMKDILRDEEKLRAVIRAVPNRAPVKLKEELMEAGINIVSIDKVRKGGANLHDIIQTAMCDVHDVNYVAKIEKDPDVFHAKNTESLFDLFVTQGAKSYEDFLSLIREIELIPADIESHGYTPNSKDFAKVIECIKLYANKNKAPKAFEKFVASCQAYEAKNDQKKDVGMLFSSLFLQYKDVFISESVAKEIEKVREDEQKRNKGKLAKANNVATAVKSQETPVKAKTTKAAKPAEEAKPKVVPKAPAKTEGKKVVKKEHAVKVSPKQTAKQEPAKVAEPEQIKLTREFPKNPNDVKKQKAAEPVKAQGTKKTSLTKYKQLTAEELAAKKEKERIIKSNGYEFSKSEWVEISKFFKYTVMGNKKPGRKSKNLIEVDYPTAEIVDAGPVAQVQPVKPVEEQRVVPKMKETRPTTDIVDAGPVEPEVVKPVDSVFKTSTMSLIKQLDARLGGIRSDMGFVAKFSYEKGVAELKGVHVDAFDMNSPRNDLPTNSKPGQESEFIMNARMAINGLDGIITSSGVDNFTAIFEYKDNRLNIKSVQLKEFDLAIDTVKEKDRN